MTRILKFGPLLISVLVVIFLFVSNNFIIKRIRSIENFQIEVREWWFEKVDQNLTDIKVLYRRANGETIFESPLVLDTFNFDSKYSGELFIEIGGNDGPVKMTILEWYYLGLQDRLEEQ